VWDSKGNKKWAENFCRQFSAQGNRQTKFIQGIDFSQTQPFITRNILIATCFDCIDSSSGLPKNRSNVSKFVVHSGIPQYIPKAKCFDSIESSPGLPKNKSNVSKFLVHSGIPNAFGIPESTTNYFLG